MCFLVCAEGCVATLYGTPRMLADLHICVNHYRGLQYHPFFLLAEDVKFCSVAVIICVGRLFVFGFLNDYIMV